MIGVKDYIATALICLLILAVFMSFHPFSSPVSRKGAAPVISRTETASPAPPGPVPAAMAEETAAVIADGQTSPDTVLHTLRMMHFDPKTLSGPGEITGESIVVVLTSRLGDGDVAALRDFLRGGGSVIFAALPDNPTPELLRLIGVESYEPGYQTESVTLHEGVLLGGMYHAERYPASIARVTLSGRCKVFARAYRDEIKEIDVVWGEPGPESTPAIWRTYYEGGSVCVINAPFASYASGAGVLAGAVSLCEEDLLYPVLGTKTVALEDFPYLSEGAAYDSRTPLAFTRDIVWPSLESMAKALDVRFTCYGGGEFAGHEESEAVRDFLYGELSRYNLGELAYRVTPGNAERDLGFIGGVFPRYAMRSLMGEPESLAALTTGPVTSLTGGSFDNGFSWQGQSALTLPFTNRGGGGDSGFAMASAYSAFGYTMYHHDMKPVFQDYDAANLHLIEMGKSLSAAFYGKELLKPVTVSEAAEKAKDFLNMKTRILYGPDGVSASVGGNAMGAAFILRTGKRPDLRASEGCDIIELENGAYLVTSSAPSFFIRLRESAEYE